MRDNCAGVIKMIDEIVERRANRELHSYNLTFSQLRILTEVYLNETEKCSMKHLERLFGVSQATIQGTVSRMVKKGLIVCSVSQEDRRAKLVMLTEEGKRLAAEAIEKLNETQEMMTAALSDDERQTLMVLLKKVHKSIRE